MTRTVHQWNTFLSLGAAVSTVVFWLGVPSTAEATRSQGFLVVCDPASGAVTVETGTERDDLIRMSDILPGERTADIWIEENCPSRRCDTGGQCASAAPRIDRNGWYVLCNLSSGDIGLVRGALPSGFSVMAGPHPSEDEADGWVADHCSGWRCGPTGECDAPTSATIGGSGGTPAIVHVESGSSQSVRVRSVRPGSPAETAGLAVGDVLRKLNGARISSGDQLTAELAVIPAGTWVIFDIERDRQTRSLGLLLPGGSLGLTVDGPSGSHQPPATTWSAGEITTTAGTPDRPPENNGGWAVGDVVTSGEGAPAPPSSGIVGPQQTRPDLSPFVAAAKASVAACAYPTALANADQMARFDPSNPWLEANHERLRQLAARQRTTEQAVWLASNQLDNGKLKDARKTVYDAADMAVACQDDAVAVLLHRIDEVIGHRKAERSAKNARLASELLAGLFVVNQAVTAHYGGTPTSTGDPAALVVSTAGEGDPCSFNYNYPSVWSTEPICGCGGYHFDPTKLRCVK